MIKHGVIYDARGLLAEVRRMVAESKRRGTLDFNINQLNPDVIQGVEAFSGASQVPAEYKPTGSRLRSDSGLDQIDTGHAV
ncbi:MAG: hypothetical protein IH876_12235 [Gemmatimonadetes bacterium]|nr:hypothetical protein [Gemmatimonadota bacterium]